MNNVLKRNYILKVKTQYKTLLPLVKDNNDAIWHKPVVPKLRTPCVYIKKFCCTINLTPRPPFLSLYPLDHSTTILVPINSLPFSCRIASYGAASRRDKRNMLTQNAPVSLNTKTSALPKVFYLPPPTRELISYHHMVVTCGYNTSIIGECASSTVTSNNMTSLSVRL